LTNHTYVLYNQLTPSGSIPETKKSKHKKLIMITIENNQRFYDGFKIVSSLEYEKTTFRYEINKLYLEKIVAVLNQARFEMLQPKVAHFAIYINPDFDMTTLIPKLKRALKGEQLLFCYSVEMKNKLHIHLMLCVDSKIHNPDKVFYHTVLPSIRSLKNVEGCTLNPRWKYKTNKTAKYYHSLKVDYEFRDAIERFSYFAKTNDKLNIPSTIKKTFATSQIKNNKYYAILGANNMLKIKQIKINESLKFSDDNTINNKYSNFRKLINDSDESKLMFHIVDTATNENIGFYGYTYCIESFDESYIVSIEIDDLYVYSDYLNRNNNNFFDILSLHLRDEVSQILLKAKSEIKDGQKLVVGTHAHFNQTVDEILKMVVTSSAMEHSLTIS
jgi:hypothetical protein